MHKNRICAIILKKKMPFLSSFDNLHDIYTKTIFQITVVSLAENGLALNLVSYKIQFFWSHYVFHLNI